jgi:hypothetical protein
MVNFLSFSKKKLGIEKKKDYRKKFGALSCRGWARPKRYSVRIPPSRLTDRHYGLLQKVRILQPIFIVNNEILGCTRLIISGYF